MGSAEQERSRILQDKAISRKYARPYDHKGKRTEGSNPQYKKGSLLCVFLLYNSVTVLLLSSLAPGPDPDGCFSFQMHYGVLYGKYLVVRHIMFFQAFLLTEKSRIYYYS